MAASTTAVLVRDFYDPATSERPQPGDKVDASPNHLVVGENARKTVVVKADFKASIKTKGVRTPVTAWVNAEGLLVIVTGQTRTLAAQELGIASVPVYVVPEPDDRDRIVDQLDENMRRTDMVKGDIADAFEQLSLLGLSEAQIAKRTHTPKAQVRAALTVARNEVARQAVTAHEVLTLEQGSILAEFGDDDQAVKALIKAASGGGFAHEAQRLRDDRFRDQYRKDLEDKLAADGVPLAPAPRYDDRNTDLVTNLKDRTGKPVDPQEHKACPGHGAFIAHSGYGAAKTEPYTIAYVCTDLKANGHYKRSDDKLRSNDMTPEQRAKASAERRDVLTSNRAWDSAETVRIEWLTQFCARKTAPKTATAFIAMSYARADHQLSTALDGGNAKGARLLGFTENTTYGTSRFKAHITALLDQASDARAQMILLALVLGAYEAGTTRRSWRSTDAATARYLEYLEANGYELSPVEQRACGRTVAPPSPEPGDTSEPDDDADTDQAPAQDQPEPVTAEADTDDQTSPDEPDAPADDEDQADDLTEAQVLDRLGLDSLDQIPTCEDLEERYADELAATDDQTPALVG